ncbi:hypothetical protein C808_01281 [Lachnospiraceae bacterium M18-1]|nr:hypothetical protein C808_01281 [Lachnospiraceae bacterium M18-1]
MKTEKQVMSLLWELFNKLTWLNGYEIKKYLQDYKPSEIHCIEYIGNNAESNVTKLADVFYMTRGAISKLSKKLLDKGLIESYQKSNNKKEVYFRLTEKGQEIFDIHEDLHKGFEKRDMSVFEQISKDEFETIIHFAAEYNKHLENEIAKLGVDMKAAGIDKL